MTFRLPTPRTTFWTLTAAFIASVWAFGWAVPLTVLAIVLAVFAAAFLVVLFLLREGGE